MRAYSQLRGGDQLEFLDSQLRNISSIAERIRNSPSSEELCAHLAQRVCPTGEISRVWMGRLDQDQVIRTEASFGYSVEKNPNEVEKPLEAKTPMPTAFRENRIIISDVATLKNEFPEYQPYDSIHPWKSAVILPTTTRFIYVFHLQNEITEKSIAESYFPCLSQLLSLHHYRANLESSNRIAIHNPDISARPDSMHGEPLTERQSEILNLIKSAMTNFMIADRIGYSESLVRRETIIIYAKLGIRGRRDLFNVATTGSLVDLRSAMRKDFRHVTG